MINKIPGKFITYLYSNFTGNFLGFIIGMYSTRLVKQFFTTPNIRNLWGLSTKKTVVDKDTFHAMEWFISVVVGFIVFEIISKWIQNKLNEQLPKYKITSWMIADENIPVKP